MAGKKKDDKDPGWVADIESYSRQIWLAGLGAYAKVGKEGVKLFENLIKDGEAAEEKAKVEIDKQVDALKGKAKSGKNPLDAGKAKAEKAKGRLTGKWNELEEAFDKRLNSAVARLGVPSRDEVKALNSKVDELTKLIEQLAGGKAAPKAKPAAAKPAAKPRARATTAKTAAAKPAAAKPTAASKPAAKPAAKSTSAAKPAAKKPAAKTASSASSSTAAKPATARKAPAKPKAAAKPKAPAKPKATPAAVKAAEPAAPAAATPAPAAKPSES
ncbi:phasin family protein [Halopseudomonas sp.]|uniref:phasin family protein n=1 Tax=Halopseudomonas sp. TaxID=2901191 RepID=UPI00300219A8